jgi:catechol 2,3-dioxygenase-like lactoylglutathione lyase family enzyme
MSASAYRSPLAQAVAEEGTTVGLLLVVADVERSVAFYRDVLGAMVLRNEPPAMLRLANAWLILNTGGGPTDDKPTVELIEPDPDRVSSFLNIRVADIEATVEDWAAKGATFLAPPSNRGPEIRCYLRDPDGHLIEVGQTLPPS